MGGSPYPRCHIPEMFECVDDCHGVWWGFSTSPTNFVLLTTSVMMDTMLRVVEDPYLDNDLLPTRQRPLFSQVFEFDVCVLESARDSWTGRWKF